MLFPSGMPMRYLKHLIAACMVVTAVAMPVLAAADAPPRLALVIAGPPNCVKDNLTIPAMKESGIDPATGYR